MRVSIVFRVRAGIYARVSYDQSGRGRSVIEQVREGRAWAEREHWNVTHVIEETGSASRYASRSREKWPEVVELIESGAIDILVTWENSRATRDLAVYAMLRDLCARSNVLWGYSGTVYDLTKRQDRFRTGLDSLLSDDEAAAISERVRRSTRNRARDGDPHGKIPFGYRREYDEQRRPRQVIDEATAPLLRRIFADAASGKSLYAIAREMTAEGIPTPRPSKYGWSSTTVQRLIQNPAYIGKRVHRGEIVGDANWPAIVDEITQQRALVAVRPGPGRRRDDGVVHLLSGLARCGSCGRGLYIVKPRGYPTYTCPNGGHAARSEQLLDDFVTARVLALLDSRRDLTDEPDTTDTELAAAVAELDALRIRMATFQDSAADGQLSAASLVRIEGQMIPKIQAAERRVRGLRAPKALAHLDLSNPSASWPGWSLEVKRTVIAASVEVAVYPTKGTGRGRRGVIDPQYVVVDPRW